LDLARLEPGLGDDQHVLRVRAQRLGDDLLRLAVAVHVGRIDVVDAALDHAPHEGARRLAVTYALVVARTGDPHRAESEATDGDLGTEGDGPDGGVVERPRGGHRINPGGTTSRTAPRRDAPV